MLATLITLQPAIDRLTWFLPQLLVFRVFLLIVPLVVQDIATLRRIHPVTWIGTGLIFIGHAGVIAFSLAGGNSWRLWLRAATAGFR